MEDKLTMLIVDDVEMNRTILRMIFEDEYRIVEADNGLSALEVLRNDGSVSIILLDLVMPKMNGIEFLETVREVPQFAQIPVIVNTQQGEADSEVQALDLGVEDFIVKPYNPRIVVRRVRNVIRKSVLERKQMEQDLKSAQEKVGESLRELKFRAERDWLTGIYNRDTFYTKTTELLQSRSEMEHVLVLWNIERFKVINDLFGTITGDQVLIKVSNQIRKAMKDVGVYGRLEADRFALCMPKTFFDNNMDEIQDILNMSMKDIKMDYPILSHIGVYVIHDIYTPVDLMCDRAMMALQTIKGNYLKRRAYYNDGLRDDLLNEQGLIGEMETALREKQFFINLQPIYSSESQKPVSAEALVRWNHPVKGIIAPDVFIPLFEKNGFIAKLDYFVWEEVCKYLSWSKKNDLIVLPISVNVSRANFYSNDLCKKVLGLVEKYKLDPSMLKLEITESMYMDNPYQLLETMQHLQDSGIRILMDDFGSGYSSLNMLKDVPVDVLKVDMKFIDALESSERAGVILTYVVRMAKELNMQVVAEGVENINQFSFLKDISCDCIQGYYFSRPLSVQAYGELLGLE